MAQRTRSTQFGARILTAALVGILCTLLTACEAGGAMPVPTPTPSATSLPKGDGVLTLGTLLPTTGASAFLGKAQDAGVELAVREINEAGGVNGKSVVAYHADSGDASTTKAEDAFADLVAKNVDVLIGPSSSALVERLLPAAASAGVVMISPSATSSALTSLDDSDLLFRTIPSEALEGKALADIIGEVKVAVISSSDDAARSVLGEFTTRCEKNGGELVASETLSATPAGVHKIVSAITAAKPDAVALISSATEMEANTAIILALSETRFGGAKLWLTSQSLADYSLELPSGSLPPGALADVNGIRQGAAPDAEFQKRVKSADPSVSSFRFAAEAYDATILAALAATVVGDDSGRAVASVLRAVSKSETKCTSFGECLEVLKTRDDIDYDGVSGPISLDKHGDPRSAPYGVYKYGSDNKFTLVDTVTVD